MEASSEIPRCSIRHICTYLSIKQSIKYRQENKKPPFIEENHRKVALGIQPGALQIASSLDHMEKILQFNPCPPKQRCVQSDKQVREKPETKVEETCRVSEWGKVV
jgi:hypothetical protein